MIIKARTFMEFFQIGRVDLPIDKEIVQLNDIWMFDFFHDLYFIDYLSILLNINLLPHAHFFKCYNSMQSFLPTTGINILLICLINGAT